MPGSAAWQHPEHRPSPWERGALEPERLEREVTGIGDVWWPGEHQPGPDRAPGCCLALWMLSNPLSPWLGMCSLWDGDPKTQP